MDYNEVRHQKDIYIYTIRFLVFSGILIDYIIPLPSEIVFFVTNQLLKTKNTKNYFRRKKYYVTYQTTIEYEK